MKKEGGVGVEGRGEEEVVRVGGWKERKERKKEKERERGREGREKRRGR